MTLGTNHDDPEVEIRLALPSELALLRAIDDDAVTLYAEYGTPVALEPDHPFASSELERWLCATESRRVFLAVDAAGNGLGFAALDRVDGEPYLDQLSVRRAAMRRGIGARLIRRSVEWAREAGGPALWLTTYRHVPFNLAYYERHGFAAVPEGACGPGILHHLEEQRRALPKPEERVAMRRPL